MTVERAIWVLFGLVVVVALCRALGLGPETSRMLLAGYATGVVLAAWNWRGEP